MKKNNLSLIQQIQTKIHFIRGYPVMLDSDLAELYGVETKVLNQSVRRNLERFPADFMIQLTVIEAKFSRSQFVTLNDQQQGKNIKYRPFAFTEQGIAMLSSVLRSERAIEMNIEIVRAFIRMYALKSDVQTMEQKLGVFEAIRQIMESRVQSR